MVLSDKQILEARQAGTIGIEPFDERCLHPASYDLRVGEEAFSSTRRELIRLREKGILVLEPGDFVILSTLETLRLSLKHAGRIGIRSHFTRRGVIPLIGPQVDPGFDAPLHIGLYNVSPNDVVLRFEEPFCTVEFHELSQPAERPYAGPYQHQRGITASEMEDLLGGRGMTFAEVLKLLGSLATDVKALTGAVRTTQWVMGAGLAVLSVLMSIMTAVVAFR